MNLTFNCAQQQVDDRVKQHPDGYFSDEECFDKLEEEKKEMQEALSLYHENPSEENLKALQTEFGDELFAIICLANKLHFSLEECFDLMIKKNQKRAKNNYEKEE
ncbi:MAG: MazG nucleotide pyrophosphohydrolase domain-containing protein [Candidatus Absconditabacterales bacterium]|jgi:NTP pyrophosphatase (non-canonical NTP hydrolase)